VPGLFKFTTSFGEVFAAEGIEVIRTLSGRLAQTRCEGVARVVVIERAAFHPDQPPKEDVDDEGT
jgi:hypothetical protein